MQLEPPKEVRFFLMRHGETDMDRCDEERCLNQAGVAMIHRQAKVLANSYLFHLIISSPKKRALQTAQIVARGHPAVRMVSQALVPQMPTIIKSPRPKKRRLPFRSCDEEVYGGGDGLESLVLPCLEPIRQIVREYYAQSVLVVGHGHNLSGLAMALMPNFAWYFSDHILRPGECFILERDGIEPPELWKPCGERIKAPPLAVLLQQQRRCPFLDVRVS